MRRPDIGPAVAEDSVDLLGVVEPVKHARHWLRDRLVAWQLAQETADDVTVVASELIANATLHAPPVCRLRLVLTDSDVLVEVADSSAALPRVLLHDVSAESGRGMLLIARLTRSWGSNLLDDIYVDGQPYKLVWAIITRTGRQGRAGPVS